MEEFNLQEIYENAEATTDYKVSHKAKGRNRWYFDETDYEYNMDLTDLLRGEE